MIFLYVLVSSPFVHTAADSAAFPIAADAKGISRALKHTPKITSPIPDLALVLESQSQCGYMERNSNHEWPVSVTPDLFADGMSDVHATKYYMQPLNLPSDTSK